MTSLEDVKFIDARTKDCVYGFMREAQKSLPDDNIYYTIPTLVIHWCLLYFHVQECFDPDLVHKTYSLQQDNSLLTKKYSTNNSSAYLSKKVNKGVHCWRFELMNVDPDLYTITIGVWKTRHEIDTSKGILTNREVYGWVCTDDGDEPSLIDCDEYGEKSCQKGDIIDMILDLNKFELRYCVNDKDYGVAYEGIEQTEYRVVVDMFNEDDSIKLISYKQLKIR